MARHRILLALGAIVLSLAAQSSTQEARYRVAFSVDARLNGVLRQTDTGTVLRVSGAGGPRLLGFYLGMAHDSAFLGTRSAFGPSTQLAVDSIWTRHHPTVRKALHGMLVGALVGGVVQLARSLRASCGSGRFLSSNWPLPNCRIKVGNISQAAVTWGAIGGAGGAMIGMAFPEWKLRYAISSATPSRSR
ncbi:MAG TPA: hypothetical protein VF873_05705 [Gemmatimonadales bacterium]